MPGVPPNVVNPAGAEYRSETGLVTIPFHPMMDFRVLVIRCRQPYVIARDVQVHLILIGRKPIWSVSYMLVERPANTMHFSSMMYYIVAHTASKFKREWLLAFYHPCIVIIFNSNKVIIFNSTTVHGALNIEYNYIYLFLKFSFAEYITLTNPILSTRSINNREKLR